MGSSGQRLPQLVSQLPGAGNQAVFKGLSILGSYSLSKSIDSSSTDNLGLTVANPFNFTMSAAAPIGTDVMPSWLLGYGHTLQFLQCGCQSLAGWMDLYRDHTIQSVSSHFLMGDELR